MKNIEEDEEEWNFLEMKKIEFYKSIEKMGFKLENI